MVGGTDQRGHCREEQHEQHERIPRAIHQATGHHLNGSHCFSESRQYEAGTGAGWLEEPDHTGIDTYPNTTP